MTAPRQVLPGTTYLVTRRCSQRQFLLRPSRSTDQVFLYLLALAARRHGILVHAFCVLSNHYHLVVTDPRAELPAFQQLLDALVARALNAALRRWENFWAPDSYSAVALVTPAAIVEKAAYTLANPVAAWLVYPARVWPGLWSPPERIEGGPLQAKRPEHFFDPKGGLPDMVELQLTQPPGFSTAETFRALLTSALAAQEALAASTAPGFLGPARVLAQRPFDRPGTGELHHGLKPRVAARNKWKRIEALERLKEFLVSHREALLAWRGGIRDVLFPAGTYWMRTMHGAECSGAG
jgi:REP element-mobilizing transposase RayT